MQKNYPLAGVKVLELARVLAGPWAGQVLSDLGAEVIKIESSLGDETRSWGPPFLGEKLSAYFHGTNRGKKSFVADFRKHEDLEIIKRLAYDSDVIIENFKVGSLTKFNLDFHSIKNFNKSIIYCSITGFGQTGPDAHRAGYDFIIQAMGGIMDLTGEPDRDPQKPGVAHADLFTGLYSVIAIQSAIISKNKCTKKKPVHIDMSLFDTQLAALANQASSFLASGESPSRLGNTHPVIVPYQKFDSVNGPLIIACGNDQQFANFCKAFKWKFHEKKKFATNIARVKNRAELIARISEELISLERDFIIKKLQKVGVPAGPINTVEEALNEKQAIHRKIVKKVGKDLILRTPILFDSLALKYIHSSPKLGQHNAEIRKAVENKLGRKDS